MKSGMLAAESIFDLLSKSTDENKTKGTEKTKNKKQKILIELYFSFRTN